MNVERGKKSEQKETESELKKNNKNKMQIQAKRHKIGVDKNHENKAQPL